MGVYIIFCWVVEVLVCAIPFHTNAEIIIDLSADAVGIFNAVKLLIWITVPV